MDSRKNNFGSVCRQGNNNQSFRVGIFKNNIDHRGKETCAVFDLPLHNKNSAINVLLPFFFNFNIMATVYS